MRKMALYLFGLPPRNISPPPPRNVKGENARHPN